MKNKIYLDIYCLPEIDFHEKQGLGMPLGTLEFNSIVEKIFRGFENIEISIFQRRMLNLVKPFLITNLSNLIRLNLIDEISKGKYSIVHTPKELFNEFAGPRNLGKGYIADYFNNESLPIIEPFLKGFFHNKNKERIKKMLFSISKKEKVVVYNENKWLITYLKKEGIKYTKLQNSYFWDNNDPNTTKTYSSCSEVNELSAIIANLIVNIFTIKKKLFHKRVEEVSLYFLRMAYTDYENCKNTLNKKNIFFNEIYSGTCGNYLTRIVHTILQERGVVTNGFMHSGAISHINYPFDPRVYIEYEIPNNFYVFNERDASIIGARIAKYNLDTNIKSMMTYLNLKTKEANKELIVKGKRKKIVYVSTSTPGGFQFFGVDDEIRKISYENRLFEILDKLDCSIKYKTHPKGVIQNYELLRRKFSNLVVIDKIKMDEMILGDDEIFIFKMIDSTAFNEVMRSNKPAIVVSEDQEMLLTKEARESLNGRVSFVDVTYKNGLAEINEKQLEYALNRDYNMDSEFISRFQ